MGLGVGTLLSYGRPGDVYRSYEINALVSDMARRHFGFLSAEAAGLSVRLVINPEDRRNAVYGSDWVLASREPARLNAPDILRQSRDITLPPGLRPWSDDYNSLMPILK